MLHRYRSAMVRRGRERLTGLVEVDEAYLGGVEGGVFGRQTDTKAIVAIAVEIKQPKGFGRIRLQRVDDLSRDSLIAFIERAVKPGSTVHTDGWQAYWTVARPRLRARTDDHARPARSRSCSDAGRASGREPAQALAAHPPGVRRTRAPRRLPQRVHVPL
jgi:transposase-like protein